MYLWFYYSGMEWVFCVWFPACFILVMCYHLNVDMQTVQLLGIGDANVINISYNLHCIEIINVMEFVSNFAMWKTRLVHRCQMDMVQVASWSPVSIVYLSSGA